MPLDAELYAEDTRHVVGVVTIAGVYVSEVSQIAYEFFAGRVPTATITVPLPAPDEAIYHAKVTVDVGFEDARIREFTGIVLKVTETEIAATIECVGTSWVLSVEYKTTIATLDNITAPDAIEDLLIAAGVQAYAISVPVWEIATTGPRELRFQTYGDAINKIGEVDGCRWWELPGGSTVVRPFDYAPGIEEARQYFAAELSGLTESYPSGITEGRPRIRSVTKSPSPRDVKNQIAVFGASVGTPSVRIESTTQGPSPYVLAPDGSQAYNAYGLNNELIDTQAKADQVAARLLDQMNGLLEAVTVQIDGDPSVHVAETVLVIDSRSGTYGRWVVEGYSSRLGDDFSTTLTLRRLGARTHWAPVADFFAVAEREWIAGVETLVVTFDGRVSHELDRAEEAEVLPPNFWILGVAGASELGVTTYLG